MARIAPTVEAPPESAELTERRYVYNGDSTTRSSDFAPRGNRPVKRRRRSPSVFIGLLFLVSILIVMYVWNKITVNRLVVEVSDLQIQYEKILNANEFLRAEINKKSSLERISKIAGGQLGLVIPSEQPIWLNVDSERLETFRQK